MQRKDYEIESDRVIVQAPASTSNLGPGYDVLGLALDVMYDVVEIQLLRSKDIIIEVEGIEADTISRVPNMNTAGRTLLEFQKRYGKHETRIMDKYGFKIKVKKGIPPGSGIGSSGATAAATAVAINHLLNLGLDKLELTKIAMQGEMNPHADNVAPSIYGGFIIVGSYGPLEIYEFPPPVGLEFALAIPKGIKKTTKSAREILPRKVDLPKIIHNVGSVSAVVAGLLLSDANLVGKGMLGDQIVEPIRAPLYRGYLNAKNAAMESGALGATLSGAGPTIIAIVERKKADPHDVAKAMKNGFNSEGIECEGYVSRSTVGAHMIGIYT